MTVEYDGTDFHGWQVQPSMRTVAGALVEAVRRVTGETPAVTAAGRTDAGAHAHGQVAGVTLQRAWEPATLRAAVNSMLPADVVIREVAIDSETFNARRDALSRTYRYVLVCRDDRAAVTRRHAWAVGPLDVGAMRDAATSLIGTHDFGVLGGPTRPGGSTVRTVQAVDVERHRVGDAGTSIDLVVVTVRADAFLRGMMRSIVGALVAIGRGRRSVTWIAEVLDAPARPASLPVAPARGLHQWSVTYGVAA